jgi:transcription elongation GreA/GreB family factor
VTSRDGCATHARSAARRRTTTFSRRSRSRPWITPASRSWKSWWRLAVVVESSAAGDGGAGLGSTVRVADDKGRTMEYHLIGRRSQDSERHEVTLASPVGKALWGARPGDVVQVRLPNGRDRTLASPDSTTRPVPSKQNWLLQRSRCGTRRSRLVTSLSIQLERVRHRARSPTRSE